MTSKVTGEEPGRTSKEIGKEPGQTSKETCATSKEAGATGKENSEAMRERIYEILRDVPTSSAVSIARQVGLTPQGVRHHLEALKKAGRIHHEGPTKGGRWITQ